MRRGIICLSMLLFTCGAWAQCAPGIPGAGNPGCIPPNQPGSPYYQGSDQPPVSAPAIQWADRWGAVALDPESGSAGVITGATTKEEANSEAMRKCKENKGTRCLIAVSYRNQCAAVAQKSSGGPMGTASARTIDMAKSDAVEECGDATCRIVYSACSPAQRIN